MPVRLKQKLCPKGHEIHGDNAKPYKKDGKIYFSCRKCAIANTKKARQTQGVWLPPETESVMASYKEPLRPVPDGFGYYGTIAYDKTEKYTQCHLCGNFYKTLGTHVSKVHGKDPFEYKLEFGLPTTLPLTAPKLKNKNYEQWESYSPEKKKEVIANLQAGRKSITAPRKARTKALYYKNLEGRCPAQLIEKILQLRDEVGKTPSRREFNKRFGGNHAGSVELTFGSWGEAVKIAGLTPRRGGREIYDKETLIQLMINFKKDHKRNPMSTDCERGLLPSRGTFNNYFGSWTLAKKELNRALVK